ncbi:hypothetical protein GF312_13085 [Candidatus Poribacteria bacterium]|nr:hypothetical protein [Candidatus Poribacteria bacterium]
MLFKWILLLIVFSILVAGCGEDFEEYDGFAYPNIRLVMAPSAKHVEITRVVLAVSGDDMEIQECDMNIEDNKATCTMIVPAGKNRKFSIQAYSGEFIEYEGEEIIENLEPGSALTLNIEISPVKIGIQIVPISEELSVGETFQVNIDTKNVRDLFGCSFEMGYSSETLSIQKQDISPGNFLGNGSEAISLFQVEPGKISLAVTRKASLGAVNGSGTIATIRFQTVKSGDAKLEILRNDDFAFQKEDGTDINRFNEMNLEEKIITIK